MASVLPTNPLEESNAKTANRKGLLLSLLSIPIGIVSWALIWSLGYVAAISSFLIAGSAVWLYSYGAKRPPQGNTVWVLIAIILIGVVLSFLGGIFVDVLRSSQELSGKSWNELLGMPAFWEFFRTVITSPEVWSRYTNDIVMAAVFAVLGTFGVMSSLIKSRIAAVEAETPVDETPKA